MKEIVGTIDHRILLNYRIDPEVAQRQLPPQFRPKVVHGYAIGGICQVSLSGMRPKGMPALTATRSHNAAHRIAVTSSQGEGVYVPRRDTNSWVNVLSGGRVFPGAYEKARFEMEVDGDHYRVEITDAGGEVLMAVDCTVAESMCPDSVFPGVDEISTFFQAGGMGWSPRPGGGFDAIELRTPTWDMQPVEVHHQFSGVFSDETRYPPGSVAFDSAMIMRNLPHSWVVRDDHCAVCG